jgi:hypothetical protein
VESSTFPSRRKYWGRSVMARHEYPSGVPWLLFALLFAGTAGKGLYRPVGLGATANLGIPDSSFTASGQSDDQTGPEQARLYSASYGGGWVAADSNLDNTDQWLQIDLLNPQLVVKIETQGRSRAQHWTTHYKLLYSNVTTNWTVYQTGGADRIFEGNTDRYKVRETVLDPPFHARYVRFNPWGWYRKAALRVELFVCRGPSCLNPALPSGDIVPVGIGMRSSLGIADHRMTCSGHLDPQPTGSEAEAQKAMDEGECPIELKRELEAQRQRMAAEAAEAEAKAAAASNVCGVARRSMQHPSYFGWGQFGMSEPGPGSRGCTEKGSEVPLQLPCWERTQG